MQAHVKEIYPDILKCDVVITINAFAYIREFSKSDKPFFLYVAQNAPHWPLQALPEDIKVQGYL